MRTLLAAALLFACPSVAQPRPNLVLIVADDLGWGELGCYGQPKIRTPHLDRLAAQGMRFTRAYAGAPVCAPSRCVLLTGRAPAHAAIRDNKAAPGGQDGEWPLPSGVPTIAELLRPLGYATACIGKWGLGPLGSSGDPNARGFELFFGYAGQVHAHNHFPRWLWRNGEKIELGNPELPAHQKLAAPPDSWARFAGSTYAPDRLVDEALEFLRAARERPFFLYLPLTEPHLAMQPPQALVESYPKAWDEKPYLGERGYLPHPRPRAGYAAMITSLDARVGRVLAELDALGLGERTLVLLTSDNGPTHDVGGVDTGFFASTAGLRGRKGSVYEGGLRVPLLVRWPGRIAPGATSAHVCAFQDVLPTLLEAAGGEGPADSEGLSFLPELLGQGEQRRHAHLVWEFAGYGGQQAVRQGRWKAVRQRLHQGNEQLELYDLEADPGEAHDVAADHPGVVAELARILREERTANADFPIAVLDRE